MADSPIGPEYLAGFFDGEGCVHIHSKYAEKVNEERSQKTRDGIAKARSEGRPNGGPRKPVDLISVSHLSDRQAAIVVGVSRETIGRRRAEAVGRIFKKVRPQARVNHLCLRLILTNTNLHVLEAIRLSYGGHLRPMRVVGNRKPTFQLTWSGRKAGRVVDVIYPYAVVKREQLDVALAFLAMRDRGRKARFVCVSASGHGSGYVKNPDIAAEEMAIKRRMNMLNFRGVA